MSAAATKRARRSGAGTQTLAKRGLIGIDFELAAAPLEGPDGAAPTAGAAKPVVAQRLQALRCARVARSQPARSNLSVPARFQTALRNIWSRSRILTSLELNERPRVIVWNKVDRLSGPEVTKLLRTRGGVAVSAEHRTGFDQLLHKCETTLFAEGKTAQARALR